MSGERPAFIKPQQIAEYESAIRKAVPDTFFRQAAKIVESRKPADPRLKGLDVVNMAKVLVVEDEGIWAFRNSRFAVQAGHEVVAAASAADAKKVLEENGIDFIITDGLEDQWTQVHDLAKEKGIRTLVVSGSDSAAAEAEKRGVEFMYKNDPDIRTKLTDTFSSI